MISFTERAAEWPGRNRGGVYIRVLGYVALQMPLAPFDWAARRRTFLNARLNAASES